ncbi:MAG: hypothetical protein KDA25_11160 [Phycisphaerales bacterium]|nr:hypothetical protein [Phycisphaerales bacterium]
MRRPIVMPPWCAVVAAVAALLGTVAPAVAQLRVVNYNVAHLGGDLDALEDVFAALNTDDRPGFAVAPQVYVLQEVRTNDVSTILARLNAASPPGVVYSVGTYTSIGNEDGAAGAQAMFYRADTFQETIALHKDIFTGASRYADRWHLRLVGYSSPAASFYIYSAHLKAGTAQADQDDRADGADAIRDDADALPNGTNIIICGDMNIYTNTEPAYQRFISAGNGQTIDPLGSGSWAGAANAIKHSQSPRLPNVGGLTGGGMDDRFDFQLPSGELHDGGGIALLPGVYRSVGNDGAHYNDSINAGNNTYYPGQTSRSNALADDLYNASDHVPVVAEYQVPAVIGAVAPPSFGRVLQNAAATVTVVITNDAAVIVPEGADELDFTVAGANGIGGTFGGSVLAGGGAAVHVLPIDTAAFGPVSGTINVTSANEAVEGSPTVLGSSGTVVRHAAPSFSGRAPIVDVIVDRTFEADSGVRTIEVDVHNLGFDALQALLDIDAVSSPDAPFSYVGGDAADIGAAPVTLTYAVDTAGLAPGVVEATSTLLVSDEDLPGEMQTLLSVTFSVTIEGDARPIPGDLDGDGVVGPADLAILLAAWGSDDPDADLDDDGAVGPTDLAILLANWG